VLLRSRQEMEQIVARAPKGFGAQPDKYRYDVVFLNPPLTAEAALAKIAPKPGVDEVRAGAGVLYFSRLISKATQSRLPRVASMPIYKSMTIRNWRTTTTLLQMLTAGDAAT